ncbi:aminoacyl--tRNA ligase-related protein [Paenibacillus woosongensis]|uniref:Aminoacyl-tRNA synthetase class II (G/ P/ S/T) domain-containing protein n=1 Tax=Paenibacillus woosongensis TaxID=307580 RepID=A0ABQ4MLA3_9BACL|nr:aminoacyl--tRNA ligase-related protein [Paenibacillus woosongensis]GIP56764.1 hypothetical protein J15TS10_05780 [Paenibacillus woosongensis]
MNKPHLYSISNGLATFGSDAIQLMSKLDGLFLKLADDVNADYAVFPPLMKVNDLNNLDYFVNFPHLGLSVSSLTDEACNCMTSHHEQVEKISNQDIKESGYMLPSAACYNVYLSLRDQAFDHVKYYTTIARCFRNESEYNDLRRLWSFQMREIICIGQMEEVQDFLSIYKKKILTFAEHLGIEFEVEVATDPFYDKQGTKALIQKLQPVKEELVFNRTTSIASINFHRNFFGDRCNITNSKGEVLFSGCVAFGIERWLHALLETHNQDVEMIMRKLDNV